MVFLVVMVVNEFPVKPCWSWSVNKFHLKLHTCISVLLILVKRTNTESQEAAGTMHSVCYLFHHKLLNFHPASFSFHKHSSGSPNYIFQLESEAGDFFCLGTFDQLIYLKFMDLKQIYGLVSGSIRSNCPALKKHLTMRNWYHCRFVVL